MSHQFLVVGLGRLGIAMVNTLDSTRCSPLTRKRT